MNKINVEDHKINITAIGPGSGESILITIGDKMLIGIDSNAQLSYQNGDNILIESFLGSKSIFWILTHYHKDHFWNFINFFDPNRFRVVYPPDFTVKEFNEIVKKEITPAKAQFKSSINAGISQFSRLHEQLASMESGGSNNYGTNTLMNVDIIDKKDKVKSLELIVNGLVKKKGQIIIERTFRKLKDKPKVSGDLLNRTSYITLIKYGSFQGLFLGDAPLNRIKKFIKINGPLNIDFLKIAHHGSEKNTDIELIKTLRVKGKKQLALVTPYASSRLPKEKVLDLYRSYGFEVVCTLNSEDNMYYAKEADRRLNEKELSAKYRVIRSLPTRSFVKTVTFCP